MTTFSGRTGCDCGPNQLRPRSNALKFFESTGGAQTPRVQASRVTTRLRFHDTLVRWKARWGIGRMGFRVSPGLYAVGEPNRDSVVLVTANYQLSFDALRAELDGINAWVLVLDTNGINVWCAAGKGTFGTEELIRQIERAGLKDIVSHRTVILPQLGAPGVAGHIVKAQSGFKVVFGPVRARDIKAFVANDMRATPAMRKVRFDLADRLAVVPVEIVMAAPYVLMIAALAAAWQWFAGTWSVRGFISSTLPALGAFLTGTVAVPALLPWLPPRSFALKGWLAGLVWTAAIGALQGWNYLSFITNLLLLPAISAFFSLNFTGCTTYTSQSGVNREIARYARPLGLSLLSGVVLLGLMIIKGVFP